MKKNYIQISFEQIKEIIDESDPELLLKMGSPSDEYDPESNMICDLINAHNPQSPVETANIVAFVWFYHFGDLTKPLQVHPLSFEIARKLFNKFVPTEITPMSEVKP